MVYFPECGEWAELNEDQFERLDSAGIVPKKNKDFISRVSRLQIEYS